MGQSFPYQLAFAGLLARHLATPLDLPALLDDVVQLLHEHLPLEAALFFIPEEEGWCLMAARDAQGASLLKAEAVPETVGAQREHTSARTGTLLPRTAGELPPPPLARLNSGGGRWVIPLIKEDKLLALLDLYPAQPLSQAEEELLDSLQSPLVTVLHRAHQPRRFDPEPEESLLNGQPASARSASFELLHHSLTKIAQAKNVSGILQLIADYVQASGWQRVAVTLRDRHYFRVTHLASAGLTQEEHQHLIQTAKHGNVWFERLGPDYERFRHDGWYYLPARDPAVRALGLGGLESKTERSGEGTWHPEDILYMPLRDHTGHPIGLVVMDDPEDEQAPTVERMRPLQLFVRNAALMLDNRRLQWESARRLAATQLVQETAALVSASRGAQEIVQHLIEKLSSRFDYPMVAVYLREGDTFVLTGQIGYPEWTNFDLINQQAGVVGRAVRDKAVQWVPDVSEDPDYVMGNSDVVSEVAIPLLHSNEVLGLINVESTVSRPLTLEDKELLATLGEQLATAITNAQLFRDMQRHALQVKTASELSRHITSILSIEQLLSEVVQLIRRNFGYYHVHIFLHSREHERWVMYAASGEAAAELRGRGYSFAPDEGIVGHVGATGMVLLVPDVAQDQRYISHPLLPKTRAQLGIPLRLGNQVLGVLDVHTDVPHGLTESDRELLESLANQIAVALNNAQLFSEVETQLAERERLYQASFAISSAQSVEEVLEAVMRPLAAPHLIRAGLLIPEHGEEGLGIETVPEVLEVAAIWNPTARPLLIQPNTRLRAETMPSLHNMVTDYVQVVSNVQEDERLDPVTRAIISQLGVNSLALVPLRGGKYVMGWLLLMSNRLNALDEKLLKPYQTLADQAALAVERVELLSQTQLRAERLSVLNTLASNVISSLDLQKTLEDSVQAMAQLFRVRQSGLLLFEQGNTRSRLVAQYREDGFRHTQTIYVPIKGNPLTERLLETRAPVYIKQISTDPLAIRIREGTHPRSYTAMLVVPLLSRDRVIGSISLDIVGEERHLDPEEINLAQTIAAHIATAVENAKLFEEATRRAYNMETASQVGQQLTKISDEEQLMREVVQLICDRFDFYYVGIYLQSEESGRLVLREGSGTLGRAMKSRRIVLWPEQGIPGYVLSAGETIISDDVHKDARFMRTPLLPATSAQAAIPLKVGGELLGVLDVHSAKIGVFHSDTIAVLTTIADQIAIALQNARLFGVQRANLKQLQEVDRLKSEFLASMSHELRTPLNSIIGFSKIILRGIDGPITETQRQDLTSIYNSGHHLLALITDILDLSKIAAGKMDLHREALHLNEVVSEVLQTLEPQASERDLKLEGEFEDNLPMAHADKIRVRQILLNLLSNAIKFTERGGVFVNVRRVATAQPSDKLSHCVGDPHGNYLEIAVRDTGIGIKSEDQELVFEEFRQVDSSSKRRSGGTGLGLAISRRFAELHGGALWLQSRYGIGSTFRFTLPVVADSTNSDSQSTT
ncbi:MAG: GAF domain-containing protein [Ardenticatenales bacterium]|nr:GAF domain-containing protein [Ardenticatenales bacterium]